MFELWNLRRTKLILVDNLLNVSLIRTRVLCKWHVFVFKFPPHRETHCEHNTFLPYSTASFSGRGRSKDQSKVQCNAYYPQCSHVHICLSGAVHRIHRLEADTASDPKSNAVNALHKLNAAMLCNPLSRCIAPVVPCQVTWQWNGSSVAFYNLVLERSEPIYGHDI